MKPNNINQKINRLNELMTVARQRYLNAGGNPHRTSSGLKGNDYLNDEERQEALSLARAIYTDDYINNYLEKKQKIKYSSRF